MDDTHDLQVSLITLGNPSTMTGGYLFHRRLADLAPRFGARVRFVSVPARPFPLPVLSASAVLHAALRHSPDVLVIDSIAAGYLAPALVGRGPVSRPHRTERRPGAAARSRVPLVAMLHQPPGGIDHSAVRTAVQRALDRRTYRHARRLLVASQALAEQMRALGWPVDLLRVIAPGRDVAPPTAAAAGLRQGRQAALLSVGNWVRRKGALDLLDAFAQLPASTATLHMVGDPEVEREYGERVRERLLRTDLCDRVVVHGVQPPERVAALYRGADVFVLPSLVEPYGTVYAEAMACGLPVVGWAAGNLPHLARDGVEGYVLAPGDIGGLANALLRLSTDEDLRRRLAAGAARRAEQFPTWASTARAFFTELRAATNL